MFYFLMDILLLIGLVIVIVGALFVLNVGWREFTGVDVARKLAKKARAKSKATGSESGVQDKRMRKDHPEYPSGDVVVSRTTDNKADGS